MKIRTDGRTSWRLGRSERAESSWLLLPLFSKGVKPHLLHSLLLLHHNPLPSPHRYMRLSPCCYLRPLFSNKKVVAVVFMLRVFVCVVVASLWRVCVGVVWLENKENPPWQPIIVAVAFLPPLATTLGGFVHMCVLDWCFMCTRMILILFWPKIRTTAIKKWWLPPPATIDRRQPLLPKVAEGGACFGEP